MLTDGVLQHLDSTSVAALASDLAGTRRVDRWITDILSPAERARLAGFGGAPPRTAAADTFAPAEGGTFFHSLGWDVEEWRTSRSEMKRLRRLPLASRVVSGVLALPGWVRRLPAQTEGGFLSLVRAREEPVTM
ncbi:MAG: hypothetical protein NVS9B3_11860 [Gemmatimonadaceae bacterium]